MKTKEKLSPQIVAFSETVYERAVDRRLPVRPGCLLSGVLSMEREPGADGNEGCIESGARRSESQSNPSETSQKFFFLVVGEQCLCPALLHNETNPFLHGVVMPWCLNVRFCFV
jgi:hypothetical protein